MIRMGEISHDISDLTRTQFRPGKCSVRCDDSLERQGTDRTLKKDWRSASSKGKSEHRKVEHKSTHAEQKIVENKADDEAKQN